MYVTLCLQVVTRQKERPHSQLSERPGEREGSRETGGFLEKFVDGVRNVVILMSATPDCIVTAVTIAPSAANTGGTAGVEERLMIALFNFSLVVESSCLK